MPIGVEHPIIANPTPYTLLVSLPVMPIGVEHNLLARLIAMCGQVSLPVMPIGVEHNGIVLTHLSTVVCRYL